MQLIKLYTLGKHQKNFIFLGEPGCKWLYKLSWNTEKWDLRRWVNFVPSINTVTARHKPSVAKQVCSMFK